MSVAPTEWRDRLRHQAKRARAAVHDVRGYARVSVAGHSVRITTGSALQTEHTRYNAVSEASVTADLLARAPAQTVLDVGSGYGAEACLAAVAGADRVVAVDCEPSRAEYVRKNAQLNNVGDVLEQEVAHVGDGTDGTVSLDELDVDPDIVCVDIEGDEWGVLGAAPETLGSAELAYVETHPDEAPPGRAVDDLRELLASAGLAPSTTTIRGEPYLIARRVPTHPTERVRAHHG